MQAVVFSRVGEMAVTEVPTPVVADSPYHVPGPKV